jgi:tricorn protease
LALQPGQRFPFAAKSELDVTDAKPDNKPEAKAEAKVEAKPDAAKGTAKPEPKGDTKPALVQAGLAGRLYQVPLAAGNYSALRTDGKRLWWLELDQDRKTSLKTLAIDNQGSNAETVSGDVRSYELSADGKKLMLVRGGNAGAAPEILIVDAAPKLPAELPKFQVRWSDWQIATQPRAEWRQMFTDAWRMQRDHFYDKAMHGVDWQAVRAKYEPLVERVSSRGDLAELMAQMVSELGALHSQIGAGDVRAGPEEPGLAGLGARFSRVAEGWRIERIYASDPELPSEASPLAAAGLELQAGDVITAVNGRRAAEAPHLAELLRGQAGKQVLLELRSAEGKTLQRIVTPVPQRRDAQLRYNDWRQSRARTVQEASGGRIGYLHLRAMGPDDIADFAREFYAQIDREGLIIDVRFNGGGNIDSWVLEKLLRRAWAFWQRRSPEAAPPYANMQQVFRGHLAVLINENTYSDGETFAEGFKRLGLGPTIGRQTSGAGVWLSDRNRLMDNGIMRAAETGQMDPQGRFLIEGVGVKPDIEVDNPPRASFLGADAQLEAAIAHLRRTMAERPLQTPKPGPYPRPVKP